MNVGRNDEADDIIGVAVKFFILRDHPCRRTCASAVAAVDDNRPHFMDGDGPIRPWDRLSESGDRKFQPTPLDVGNKLVKLFASISGN